MHRTFLWCIKRKIYAHAFFFHHLYTISIIRSVSVCPTSPYPYSQECRVVHFYFINIENSKMFIFATNLFAFIIAQSYIHFTFSPHMIILKYLLVFNLVLIFSTCMKRSTSDTNCDHILNK